ncbi:MAG: DUF1566 domain-containing protein [Gammaproteobacteria bacterium]|nr:DUF1566 domain-containing protein [Gammaproteobacteria bacterium]
MKTYTGNDGKTRHPFPCANAGTKGNHAIQIIFCFILLCAAVFSSARAAGPFTDNGDGTVTDAATALMWQQQDDGVERDWNTAQTYCDGLSLAGYDDWRLPEIGELSTLADYDLYGPAIDTAAFPGTLSSWYWSDSTSIVSPIYAWYVDFNYGYVGWITKAFTRYVRCVRGGSGSFDPLSHLIISGAETVTDTSDGLVWQREDDGATHTWEEASARCENLVLNEKSDWRLPLVDELKRLIDYGQYSPSSDVSIFSGIRSSSYYWSDSTYINSPSHAWFVLFGDGSVGWYPKDYTHYVRCVRGGSGSFNPLDNLIISAAPTGGPEPLEVSFSAGFSGGLDPYTYIWDFGDGNTANTVDITHTYNTAGSYTAAFTVTDIMSDSLTDSVTIRVNASPIAAFSITPASGNAPLTVTLDASASADADGTITDYAWNSSDGQTASGLSSASLTFNAAGTYTITLTVTDNDGITDSIQQNVTVNALPIAAFNMAPAAGIAPLTINLDASASTDPDGAVIDYAWSSSDGQTASGLSASLTFNTASTYTITLTVTDNDGATHSSTPQNVTVTTNTSPVAAFNMTPAAGIAPLTVNLDASASTDPDGAVTDYAWSSSDGQTASGLSANLTFNAAGAYTITLIVTDDKGANASAAQTVNAEQAAFTLTVSALPADQGTVTRTPDKSVYTLDENVTLNAVPADACHIFTNWSAGNCSGTASVCNLSMDTNKTAVAGFRLQTFPLSVNAEHGIAVRTPAGNAYDCGASVRLDAVADAGYRFARWQGLDANDTAAGASATVAIRAERAISAIFEPVTHTLAVNILPETHPDGVQVIADPLRENYSDGEIVLLTAQADTASAYLFDHWEGDLTGERTSETLILSQDMRVTAVFRPVGALAVTPGLTEGVAGENMILNASGGAAPYTWTADAGELTPDSGPSVNYAAPDSLGEYVVTVQDARLETAQAAIKVYPPLLLSPQVAEPEIETGTGFTVSGGKPPYQISVTAGQTSAPLDEDGDGEYRFILTAPAAAGRETLTVRDALDQERSAAVSVTAPVPLLATPEMLTLRPGQEAVLAAAGGRPAYIWTASGGELLAATGKQVTYIASNVAGEYSVILRDSRNQTAAVTITVILTLGVSPDLATVVLGDPEPVPFHAMGGALPYLWEPVSGWISGEGADVLYLPPAEEGEHRLILRDNEDTAVTALVRVASPPILTPGQAILAAGETVQLQVSGGRAPYHWLAEAGDLGQTEGSAAGYTAPSRNGAYTVTVKDALDNQSQAKMRVTGNLAISPLKTVAATGETVHLAAARGVEPYAWSGEGIPSSGEGRTWDTVFNLAGRHEIVVTDAAGDTALAVIEVIHAALGLTPQSVFLHPGELVNFFVNGGTSPYLWSAEAGSLSSLEGQRTGYIAPDEPGTYIITVADGRDTRGRAEVTVTAAVTSAIDGSVQTERGVIRSGIVIDGVPRNEQHIFTDQGAHAELSFPLALPQDGRAYNTYGAIVWTGADAVPRIFFRVNDLFNPLVPFNPSAAFPIYQAASPGENVVVDIYRGLLSGLSGRFDFYAAYAPIEEDAGEGLLFNANPYTLEVK